MHWFIEQLAGGEGHIAIIFKGKKYTYRNLYDRIHFYYNKLKEDIPAGAVVALLSDYSFETIALFLALIENKNVIVPITTRIQAEITHRIQGSFSEFILKGEDTGFVCEKIVAIEPHELIKKLRCDGHAGLVLFSSGSTGKPKAMIHDLNQLLENYRDKRKKKMVFLIFLMFDHIGGINTLLNSLSMHIAMVLPENRTPDYIAALVEKYEVNVLPSSPTFLNLLLISGANAEHNFNSLRMITYGAETMPTPLLLRLKEAFPRVRFLQTFGTSETGISSTVSLSSTSTYMRFDDPNTEYKIVAGELWLRSKTQIMGYINNGDMKKFTDDGWFRTGDMVEEKDGYIRIMGRNSDIINVGGEKVLPSEVESVLLQMPGVQDITVFGEANPITGQMVVCKILYEDKNIKVSELKKLVKKFCLGKLTEYKIPMRILKMEHSEFTERFKKDRGDLTM